LPLAEVSLCGTAIGADSVAFCRTDDPTAQSFTIR
jgi:hypothetical protein